MARPASRRSLEEVDPDGNGIEVVVADIWAVGFQE